MDQNHLLLLGLLKAQESHGYQLMDFVERNLARITTLKKATAYYELKRLEQQGLVSVRKEQEGGRPPRQIFALTPAGETAFLDLLRENLRTAETPACSSDIGLMFMDHLSSAEAHALLVHKLEGLRLALELYRAAPAHVHASAVNKAMAHVAARLETEIAGFKSVLKEMDVPTSISPGPISSRSNQKG